MKPSEIEKILNAEEILVDTREQETSSARMRYNAFRTPYRREKLDVGDYTAEFVNGENRYSLRGLVTIERKMSIDELCSCFTVGRARFTREFERAKASGTRVYLLVEGATWERIFAGDYRSKINPKSLAASIMTWMVRYDCRIIFCEQRSSGRLIADILRYEARERLEQTVNE